MNIKLIAMDMDGTLLSDNNTILEETKQALLHLEEKGVKLVLASGRSYYKLLDFAKELKMDVYGGYLAEINGLAIYDVKHGTRIRKPLMPVENYKELFLYFKQFPVEIIGTLDRGLIDYIPDQIKEEKRLYREEHQIPEECPWTAGAFHFVQDHRKGYPDITYISSVDEIQMEVNKVCIAYKPKVIEQVMKEAQAHFKDRYWIGRTTPRWLEIMMPNIHKGAAVLEIAQKLNIKNEEILCFGDGENDISMFECVTYGIAMGNALDSVKAAAYGVTDTNVRNGIAKALYQFEKDGAF